MKQVNNLHEHVAGSQSSGEAFNETKIPVIDRTSTSILEMFQDGIPSDFRIKPQK